MWGLWSTRITPEAGEAQLLGASPLLRTERSGSGTQGEEEAMETAPLGGVIPMRTACEMLVRQVVPQLKRRRNDAAQP
jgi:hypothetical protein